MTTLRANLIPAEDLSQASDTPTCKIMNRVVEPEILDSLAFDDPRAIRNRAEIKTLNRIMGNFRWFSSVLGKHLRGDSILELGAGDGSMGMHLLSGGVVGHSSGYCGVDLIPRPECWPACWNWWQEDVTRIRPDASQRVLLANLILHQFKGSELRRIGQVVEASAIDRILICEPLRRRIHLWQVQLTRLLGMGPIALHDARVSIRAGFRGLEVCDELGLDPDRWKFQFRESFLGSNRVICIRT